MTVVCVDWLPRVKRFGHETTWLDFFHLAIEKKLCAMSQYRNKTQNKATRYKNAFVAHAFSHR